MQPYGISNPTDFERVIYLRCQLLRLYSIDDEWLSTEYLCLALTGENRCTRTKKNFILRVFIWDRTGASLMRVRRLTACATAQLSLLEREFNKKHILKE